VKPYSGGIRHDYKDRAVALPASRRRWLLFVLGLSIPLLGVLLLAVGEPQPPPRPAPMNTSVTALEPAAVPSIPVAVSVELPDIAEAAIDKAGQLLDLIVKRGDTLEVLFKRNGLSLADLAAMVRLPEAGTALKLLKPGDRLAIEHDNGRIVSLQRELNEAEVLSIARGDAGFSVSTLERAVDIRVTGAHGTIETSLFEAGTEAGLSDAVTMQMATIFQWDIDFIQDVRVGDEFTVIHEEIWRDGVKLRNGEIVATEFVNQGKRYRAARYRNGDGRSDYFTPDGRSVRKAFIRAPVEFTRISSNFNPNRRHPVLNSIRAHRGVDYAAPTGTPVQAAGDGKVIFRGVQGGYGNAVVIQHGGNITTLYGHLSRFGTARVGGRVRQGEVIGYVGKTGLATGPHLHYEYRVGGVHRNPRTVPLPPADPVPAGQQDDFLRTTATLWQQLDLYQRQPIATIAQR
jgi:murein DD-endopeptidase MepM/ murein hydrolase activator NlpD